MELLNDEGYMRLALQMAEKTQGQTGVNPVVGCVIVKEGRIIGMGAHLKRGTAHAEVHALNMAGEDAEGSTVYVTLEPCSHYGRTPPCSQRLIDAKVKRVIVACEDPNPDVAGSGIQLLRTQGIEVQVGLLEEDAKQLNEMFNKYIITRKPFVTLKSAATLDGKVASKTGDSQWISGEASRSVVHTLRHRHQAIMVGSGTVIQDNPKLTTRTEAEGIHPVRVIIDGQLKSPPNSNVFQDQTAPSLVFTTEQAAAERSRRYGEGVEIIPCGTGAHVDLHQAMTILGEREIGSILLEGGGRLNGAMLTAGLVDKCILFFAPKVIGGGMTAPSLFEFPGFDKMEQAITFNRIQFKRYGDDLCIIGYPQVEVDETNVHWTD